MALTLAVVGATGAVGQEMLRVLEQRRFPHGAIRLFASPRSAGKTLRYRGQDVRIEPLDDGWHRGVGLALMSAGSGPSKKYAKDAVADGVSVVDNSSAFRAHPACHLIVPEVNAHTLPTDGKPVLAAVPNCSAIIMLVALNPLREAFGVSHVSVSTYQAASGAGAQAMDELRAQTLLALEGTPPERWPRTVFNEPYAFNLFSHNAGVDAASGYNGEELKMISETRRIWDDPGVLISPTCVRVPTMRAHAESVTVTMKTPVTEAQVRRALDAGAGVRVIDDRAANVFPTPLKATGGDQVLVGRIRPDLARVHELHGREATLSPDTPCDRWSLFIAGDQLRTGAALTAVKIAELIVG